MRDTVLAERRLSDGGGTDRPSGELVEVIIVTGMNQPSKIKGLGWLTWKFGPTVS
jgi:hypothetical protein